jgi:putative hydrolase of the HAD superfamily
MDFLNPILCRCGEGGNSVQPKKQESRLDARIKTVIFDLGNVLVFFSFEKIIAQVSSLTGLSPQAIHELLVRRELHGAYESGKISSENIYQIFLKESPKPFTPQEFFFAASNIFQPNDSIFPLLKTLKKKDLRLVLLSNTSPAHYDFLTPRLPILNLFDAKVLSFEVGALKPHPRIYSAALEAAQCSPQECFYTDDIPEYILAARTYGIDAEVFTDVKTLQEQFRQRSLV